MLRTPRNTAIRALRRYHRSESGGLREKSWQRHYGSGKGNDRVQPLQRLDRVVVATCTAELSNYQCLHSFPIAPSPQPRIASVSQQMAERSLGALREHKRGTPACLEGY